MAAFTSSQSGNWGSSSTWGGAGVPGSGDTVTIGAHTVTVEADRTIGTSPNDTTTYVIDMTSASSVLILAAGVTLTVKGNIRHVNSSTHTQQAGSTLTFDNSSSGGSPVYQFTNIGGSKFNFNGTSGSGTVLQAISGQTCSISVNWKDFVASYTTFRRVSGFVSANAALGTSGTSITFCTFDTCGQVNVTQASATQHLTFTDNVFTGSTHATDSLKLTLSTGATTSVRQVKRNVLDKQFNNLVKNLILEGNVLAGGITCYNTGSTSFASSPRNNWVDNSQNLNGGNGMALVGSWYRNYFVFSKSGGNPHFVSATAGASADETIAQCIFESQTADLVDVGDCILVLASATSGSNKIIGRNNLVLPSGYSGNSASSGTLLTFYNNNTAVTEWYRNTVNVNRDGVQSRGTILAVAEASTGGAGQVAAFKSNIAWGSSSGQGFLGERVSGNVKDIITAAGADYNWRHNSSAGDNLLGYEDKAASNTLWTAGNAVAAGVDVHQGSGDPQFYSSSRNMAAWCSARGYGAATFAAALSALQAAPSRIADLIAYVFEGFRPGNSSCRNAAHDGGCVGAANYYKSTRTLTELDTFRATLSGFGVT